VLSRSGGMLFGMLVVLASTVVGHAEAHALAITDEVYGCSWNTDSGGCPLDVPNPSDNWFVIGGPNDTATPGAGDDFTYTTSIFYMGLDIGDGTIDVTYSCVGCGTSAFSFAITGIDSIDITGFALLDADGLPFLGLSFGDDWLRFDFDGAAPGGSRTASFSYTAVPSIVPEPSSALLLGAGMLGFAVNARRRKA